MHEKMSRKRFKKLEFVEEKYPLFQRLGPEKADIGIVCWGSSKGPVEEAMRELAAKGVSISAFVPRIIMPFPKKAFLELRQGREDARLPRGELRRPALPLPEDPRRPPRRARASSRGRAAMNLSVTEVKSRIESVLSETGAREEVTA